MTTERADLAAVEAAAETLLAISEGHGPPLHQRAIRDLLAALRASQAEVADLRAYLILAGLLVLALESLR